jgi:hypothetical protein
MGRDEADLGNSGNNECLPQAVQQCSDNGSNSLQFFLCDEDGLGNRVVLYETITGEIYPSFISAQHSWFSDSVSSLLL